MDKDPEKINDRNREILAIPFQMFIDEIEKYDDILKTSILGLSVIKELPNTLDSIAKTQEELATLEASREKLIQKAELAKNEIDNGFSFFYNQAIIVLYSMLEGTIKRFIINYFGIDGNLTKISQLKKIKISLSEYYKLNDMEQLEYLFQQYEKNETIGLQYGIKRFETLLKPIGFSGKVNNDISKNIFELSQIRNNLIHRGGITDKYLMDSCPWLNFKIGDKITISKDLYLLYGGSAIKYITLIIKRISEKERVDGSKKEKVLTDFYK